MRIDYDKERRTLLRRSQSGRRKRTGRRKTRSRCSERRGEQIQPHRNRGGSDKQTYEGEIADAYRTRRVPLRTEQKLGRSARTNPDARQAQAERTHRRTAFRHYAEGGRRAAYKPRVCREKRR